MQTDKIRAQPFSLQRVFNGIACEARQKAQRHIFYAQVRQHRGDVDPLAAAIDRLIAGPVHSSFRQVLQLHHIVDGRIECNCIDHMFASLIVDAIITLHAFNFKYFPPRTKPEFSGGKRAGNVFC